MSMGVAAMEQNDVFPLNQNREIVDGVAIVELYAALKQGQSVKQWHAEYKIQLANIDVRRFISFGVIKGILYRVHKYAYASGPRQLGPEDQSKAAGAANRERSSENRPSIHSEASISDNEEASEEDEEEDLDVKALTKYLDGMHCFDQICTELDVSEKELTSKLKRYGEVHIIHR